MTYSRTYLPWVRTGIFNAWNNLLNVRLCRIFSRILKWCIHFEYIFNVFFINFTYLFKTLETSFAVFKLIIHTVPNIFHVFFTHSAIIYFKNFIDFSQVLHSSFSLFFSEFLFLYRFDIVLLISISNCNYQLLPKFESGCRLGLYSEWVIEFLFKQSGFRLIVIMITKLTIGSRNNNCYYCSLYGWQPNGPKNASIRTGLCLAVYWVHAARKFSLPIWSLFMLLINFLRHLKFLRKAALVCKLLMELLSNFSSSSSLIESQR
jgi:hypothetical protein